MRILDLNTATATTVTENTVVALGFFDGVHIGHRYLLKTAVEEAKSRGISALALTFSEEGSELMKSPRARLCSEEERIAAFEELGVRYVALLNFNEIKNTAPEDFVRDIIIGECHADAAVCGFNFRYGKSAAGNADTLSRQMKDNGRATVICEPYLYDGESVSSSRIRECIAAGDMERANKMLGGCFSVTAEVSHGKELGRMLGMPTANQAFPENKVIPRFGVYATRVTVDGKKYNAVTNIGIRPTVDDGEFVNCESHIIDYTGDLYGKVLRIELCRFIREEKKFPSVDALKSQIEKDRKEAIQWLKTIGQN